MPKIRHFSTAHETEVRLSVLLLILFLFLMNFVSIYMFNSTQASLQSQFRERLAYLGSSIKILFSTHLEQKEMTGRLWELTSLPEVKQVDIYSKTGELCYSSHSLPALYSRLKDPIRFQAPLGPVKDPFVSLMGNTPEGEPQLDYYYPIPNLDSLHPENTPDMMPRGSMPVARASLQSTPEYWAVIRVNAHYLKGIERGSKIAFWILAPGFLAALVASFFIIRGALRPYRVIKAEAAQANLLSEKPTAPGEDLVVESFKHTIAELKEKEKILQGMYLDKSRLANNLTRLNEYILSGMQSGVIICNARGEVTRVNHSACQILGYKEGQLAGRRLSVPFGEESPLAMEVEEALTSGKTCQGLEVEMYNQKGEKLVLEVNTSLIKDDEEELLGVTLLLADITQLHRLKEELFFKEKMAALGEMTAGLAHQLRNAMGSIYGFASLLKKAVKEPNQVGELIEEIGQETKTLETLLEKFLNFSKPLSPQKEPLNLEQLVKASYQAVAKLKSAPACDFELKMGTDLPPVPGDKLLIQQCLQNLFQNALEAMPQGGKLTVVVKKSGEGEPEGIQVEVEDTGLGMTQREMDKIFEPFYSNKAVGTGLGLSVVKKIISLHSGKIKVESAKQEGSKFTICLPAMGETTKVEAGAHA